MKILFSLLAILLFNKECDQKKSAESDATTDNSEKVVDTIQDVSIIWYEATTRGFYEKIWVTKDSTIVTTDRNHLEKISYKTEDSDWKLLVNLTNKLDLKTLPEIEAPTSMRHYDGAAIAKLGVIANKIETISNDFDHEHPPKAIESIVKKVLSMKDSHQKK